MLRARRAWTLLALSLLLLPALASVGAAATDAERVDAALAWLSGQSLPEGSFLSPYVVEAAAGAGLDARAWPSTDASALSLLRASPPSTSDDYGPYKSNLRIAYAMAVAGYDPRDLGGFDGVAAAWDGFAAGQFGDPQHVNDDAFAILALRAAGEPADGRMAEAARALRLARAQDGGWAETTIAVNGGTEQTGMALAALHAAGSDVRGDLRASAFLDTARRASGGYAAGASATFPANCQSTVWAIHARALLGEPEEPRALDFLRALQMPDGGFRTAPAARASDVWCTLEVVPLLAGARHPFLGYAPGIVTLPALAAGETGALAVDGPFERARWDVAGRALSGASANVSLPRAGRYPVALHAEGPDGHMRWHGTLVVGALPPQARAEPGRLAAFVRERVALDASASLDPDGRVARVLVDWGDGATSEGAPGVFHHAYASPGARSARVVAIDADGLRSAPLVVPVDVANRAPAFTDAPAFVLGNRSAPLALHAAAADPDGDPVALLWRLGAEEGALSAPPTPRALGNATLSLVARDPHGAEAVVAVPVRVENLPPRLGDVELPPSLEPGAVVVLRASARDADGPAPRIAWRIGERAVDGERAAFALPAGSHVVEVVATDADGATDARTWTLLVDAREAPVARSVANVSARLAEGELRVRFEAGGDATVRWESDAGSGAMSAPSGDARIPLPGATRATVRIEASGASARIDVLAEAPASARPTTPAREPRERGVLDAAFTRPVVELVPLEAASAPASATPREAPLPAWTMLALAATALLARRGRRAR